jgi:hypothetical protein
LPFDEISLKFSMGRRSGTPGDHRPASLHPMEDRFVRGHLEMAKARVGFISSWPLGEAIFAFMHEPVQY